EMVFLTLAIMDRDARLWLHLVEDAAKIDALRLPVAKRAAHVELSDLPDHLAEIAEAEPCHQLADFLGDKEKIVDDVFGRAGEPLAQHRVLRRDAHRAGVQMTLAH